MPKIGTFIHDDPSKYISVDSRAYGRHLRAKRGTHTPLVVTDAMRKAGELLKSANQYAKVIFDAFRPFCKNIKDGKLWSRLVSLFRKQLGEGAIDLSALHRLSFRTRRNLASVLAWKMEVTQSGDSEKSLEVKVISKSASKISPLKTDGYEQIIIAVVLDEEFRATVFSDAKLNPVSEAFVEHVATFVLHAGANTAIIALKCTHQYRGQECAGIGTGMNVVKILEL